MEGEAQDVVAHRLDGLIRRRKKRVADAEGPGQRRRSLSEGQARRTGVRSAP